MAWRKWRHGIRWRLHGLRQDVAATWLAARRGPGRAPSLLLRWGRDPTQNLPTYLQSYGADALRDVLAACEAGGVRAFVTFGTLLGMVRENGFIQHDMDIDLGVLDEDWPRLDPVLAALRGTGWRVRVSGDHQATASHRRSAHVAVDLFRFTCSGARLASRATSEQGNHHYEFPSHLVEPLRRRATPWGLDAWVPADPEAFLAHHYGPDWRTPRSDWDYRRDATSAEKGRDG